MEEKKIGIITLHRNVNFGANLQAYASCKYLHNMGYNAKVVDYLPSEQDTQNNLFAWLNESWKNGKQGSVLHKFKLGTALLLSAGWKRRRLKAFSSFRKKYMNLTPDCKSAKDVAALDLNTVVCGSDQIWNPEITEGVNPLYFGKVDGVNLKVSYAASMGRDNLDSADEIQVAELVKNLDYCSVREIDTAEYIKKLSGKSVECVCDPVFLLNKSDYEEIIPKRIKKKPYILLYSVVSNNEMTLIAEEYASKKGLQLIEIASGKTKCKHKQIVGIGPLEFLNYFAYAETVFTNSFHGTAFSIIFEKDFYVVNNKARGSRITNLLEKAGLGDRMIEQLPSDTVETIDYTTVQESVSGYIESSKTFLKKAFSSVKTSVIQKNCTGCGACQVVCNKDAIRLSQNKEGFFQAFIDNQKCVNCNLCKKVCPAIYQPEFNSISETYAFKAEDKIRKTSTSGGAFSALANEIISKNGSVYAVGALEHLSVKHVRCTTEYDVEKIRGVKYIQSDFSICYNSVERDLKNGLSVLVTGTPCQIAGMKKYAEQKKLPVENLYLVDIICHGIPSPSVFAEYYNWLEKKYNCSVKEYYFRNKVVSWRGASCRVVLSDGRELNNTRELNCFLNTYYSGNITCESCYECPYAKMERVSDLTISDYWGIEDSLPEFEDALGVSMVLVNTQKGKSLFESCTGQCKVSDINKAKQPQLNRPCERPDNRQMFWNSYFSSDLENAFNVFGGYRQESFIKKAFGKVKRLLKD